MRLGRRDFARRWTFSSSGSATRARSTRRPATTSGSWSPTGWPASWSLALASKFTGRLAEVRDGDARLALLEPQTFMNDSGRSVAAAMRFYKLEPDALVVVHDEIDLELGDVRAKSGGGLAGHNGLRSLATRWAPPTSRGCASAWAGRSGAIRRRWPTGC